MPFVDKHGFTDIFFIGNIDHHNKSDLAAGKYVRYALFGTDIHLPVERRSVRSPDGNVAVRNCGSVECCPSSMPACCTLESASPKCYNQDEQRCCEDIQVGGETHTYLCDKEKECCGGVCCGEGSECYSQGAEEAACCGQEPLEEEPAPAGPTAGPRCGHGRRSDLGE